jgi:hypothetical protein
VFKDKSGKYILSVFLILWAFIQYPMWFIKKPDRIESYNTFFEKTHHLIEVSHTRLIKDTYHIVLDTLILLALVSSIVYIVYRIKTKKSEIVQTE